MRECPSLPHSIALTPPLHQPLQSLPSYFTHSKSAFACHSPSHSPALPIYPDSQFNVVGKG